MNCRHCDFPENSPIHNVFESDYFAPVHRFEPASSVAPPTEPIIHVRPKVSEGEHLTSVSVAQSGAGASSSFPEMEVRATVALDSGDGGTRRACNNENCSQDYGHKGLCDRPSSPSGQVSAHPQQICKSCHHLHQQGRVTCGQFIRKDPHQGEISCLCASSPTGGAAEAQLATALEAGKKLQIVKFVSDGDGDWVAVRRHGFDKLQAALAPKDTK